jgi:hypothetical protein
VTDLPTQVLAAIDQAERDAPLVHRENCAYLAYLLDPNDPNPTWPCDCGEPDRIRRRCAADRRTVETWLKTVKNPFVGSVLTPMPPYFIRNLAEGYGITREADRG